MTILLLGCGGGSSNGESSSATNSPSTGIDIISDQVMVLSQPYVVYRGDKVIKTSDDALLKITHTDKKRESVIKLLEGNATIIRN